MKWHHIRAEQPFGLTERQAQAVAMLVKHGHDKLVARELDIQPKAANRLLIEAQRTVGVTNRVHLALKWKERRP